MPELPGICQHHQVAALNVTENVPRIVDRACQGRAGDRGIGWVGRVDHRHFVAIAGVSRISIDGDRFGGRGGGYRSDQTERSGPALAVSCRDRKRAVTVALPGQAWLDSP